MYVCVSSSCVSTIFDNLTKTIAYTVTHLVPEAIPVLLTLALGFPLALSGLLILTIDLFTELPPAVSLAYEPSEANVMARPPRNAKTDRLVTRQVALYAITQAGLIEAGAGLLGYFLVFNYYGQSGSDLFMSNYFNYPDSDDMPAFPGCQSLSSYGTEHPYTRGMTCFAKYEQELVLRQAQTCYFVMLTTSQMFHIFFCKTRTENTLKHGIFRNELTLYGVIIELCLILLIVFPPSSHTILTSEVFPPRFWALIPVGPALLCLWQEGRKWYVRRNPQSWIARKMYDTHTRRRQHMGQ